MNEKEILKEVEGALAIGAETSLVEFKDARGGFPKAKVKKTLSAFGNTSGGIIVFGVEEDSTRVLSVVGQIDVSSLQERMSDLSANEMSAVLRLQYHILNIKGVDILAVYIPECENRLKPYYYTKDGLPHGAYVRDSNTDRKMTDEEMRSYVRNGQVDDYDGTCVESLSENDLSDVKIKYFLEESAKKVKRDIDINSNYQNVLQNIGVLKMCDSSFLPTIAGYLIFAKDRPQNNIQFERYLIRCVRYKGSGVHTDILDKSDIGGTLDEQIDAMHSFILRNIKKEAKIIGTKRVERYEYPEEGIREIVANAVIHRDYRITQTYTQVNIFEDRIEVFNPGNLPPGVTVENIKDAQVSRNKIIAARLNEMDYLEEYGRGINIAFTKMKEWDLLPPIFKNTSNSFRVILPGRKLSLLNERQLKIWEFVMDNQKVTRKDITEQLAGVPIQTISNDLRKMKDLGLVNTVGKTNRAYYEPTF